METLEKYNRQLVTFCAVALLFLGSLYYFVSVAFENKAALEDRPDDIPPIQEYLDAIK